MWRAQHLSDMKWETSQPCLASREPRWAPNVACLIYCAKCTLQTNISLEKSSHFIRWRVYPHSKDLAGSSDLREIGKQTNEKNLCGTPLIQNKLTHRAQITSFQLKCQLICYSGSLGSACWSETIELINIILEGLSEKIEPERIIREHVKPTLTYRPHKPERHG